MRARICLLTAMLGSVIVSCSSEPGSSSSRLLEDEGGSASIGFTISGDGVGQRTRLEMSFGDFEHRSDRDREGGGEREPSGLGAMFREIASLFDGDPAPTGEPREASGQALTREVGERLYRGGSNAPAAQRTGKTEEREERYQGLREADAAFAAQMTEITAANAARTAAAGQAAAALERLVSGSIDEHNAKVRVITASAEDLLAAASTVDRRRYRTDPSTPAGQRLDAAAKNVAYARSQLDQVEGAERLRREELVAIAEAALASADELFLQGDPAGGDAALELAYAVTDAALGFVPGVGWAKDVCEAVTGVSLVSGAPLSDQDRLLAAVGALTGGIGSKLGSVRKIGSVLRRLGRSAGVSHPEAALAAVEGAEKVVDFAKGIGLELKSVDAARLKNNPLNGTTYTDKVLGQMANTGDKFHAFPKEVDNFAGLGKKGSLVGGDGIARTKIKLDGEYAGKKGTFEWIIEPSGQINHRQFESE